jgi:putative nucleotidyltransferase with HDIG domain
MRLEFINRVKEDEVLGKSILSNDGKMLLKAGVRLTEAYINKLRELSVFYVYIEDERLDDVVVEDTKLMELKQITMQNMSRITKNVGMCKKSDLKASLSIVEDMIDYVLELGDVDKSIYDIQTYDNYTYVHSLDTCIMAAFLGLSCGFGEWELKELGIGAILHDVGKTRIPHSIINKKTKLSQEEFDEIKKHTIYGGEILRKNVTIPDSAIKIVEQHHERVDETGYPFGLHNKQISRFAKVVCVCDVYDAVSNDRCYRGKFSPSDAYELILAGSGTSFDPGMVRNFKNTFSIYPLGACVQLSNGEKGYVISQNLGFPDRPIIRILMNVGDYNSKQFYEIDLLKNSNITILDIA